MAITDIAERISLALMPRSSAFVRISYAASFALAAAIVAVSAGAQTPSLIPQQQAGPQPNGMGTPAARPIGAGGTGIVTSPPNFEKLRIQPGFLLHISVFNEPQLTQELRVNDSGDVVPALAGPVHVQGMNE